MPLLPGDPNAPPSNAPPNANDRDVSFILRTAVITLSTVIIVVVVVLLWGLTTPKVDDGRVLAILGPAFQTVIGCFVGLLGGLLINRSK